MVKGWFTENDQLPDHGVLDKLWRALAEEVRDQPDHDVKDQPQV